MTVKPLVAAADGSDESLQAIEWAAREAVLRSAPLRIVAAASRPPRLLDLLAQPDSDYVVGLIREERPGPRSGSGPGSRGGPWPAGRYRPAGRPAGAGGH